MNKKIGFIGFGNMAGAIHKGIAGSGHDDFIASDKNPSKIQEAGIKQAKNNQEVIDESDIIFLGIKPNNLKEVLEEINPKDKIIISIVAGIKTSFYKKIHPDIKLIRLMPNTPSQVLEMAGGFCTTNNISKEEKESAKALFKTFGIAFEVTEAQIDSITALSGSGPAFVARLIEAFIEGGIEVGLDEAQSKELAIQTFLGTAKFLKETDMQTEDLVKMVSSPNGTTIAGRAILEASKYKEIIKETMQETKRRSIEMGEELDS